MSWVLKEKQNRQERQSIQAEVTEAREYREGVINHCDLAGEKGQGGQEIKLRGAGLVEEPRMHGSAAWAASRRLSGALTRL